MTESSSSVTEDGIPRELKEKLASFDTHLTDLESSLSPLLSIPRAELAEQLDTIDAAKVDLVSAYTINSLFWMYLNCCGINPKEHAVKQELTRIQSYMARVKEIEDKKKAPKIDKSVSKRFVRSALWQAAQNKGEGGSSSTSSSPSNFSSLEEPKRKRKREKR
ncbi:hypothetical protein PoB_000885100 [Plakobranchus ocellatus]|uniref:Nuclear nucleic acid-binding protein C1D n=1 Tax=Plakobranchus ocellatus TaxID=259542 RepID=A0AAV3YJ21_9GAST|nr:hypothetical protein PoB_000885100 [Plakobranchus ocellatus]